MYPSSARRGLVIFHEHITDLLSGGVSRCTLNDLWKKKERIYMCFPNSLCSANFLGLSGTDLPLLRLLQGGQNTLSKDDLQFAAGLPAGHCSLPVPQSHLDCKKVQKGLRKKVH